MIEIAFEPHFERAAAYDVRSDAGRTKVGECDYFDGIHQWTVTHTEVDPAYGGQGIAKRLVECVMEEAKKRDKKLASQCSYASKVIEQSVNN